VLVTTEDEEIKQIAEEFGAIVPFLRPEYLATDKSVNTDVILHVIEQMPDFDILCYLQPTSPLRTSEDIDLAFEHFYKGHANCCVSVQESTQSPFWSFTIDNHYLKPLFTMAEIPLSRQDLIPTYTLNGAIYIANKTWYTEKRSFLGNETLPFVMPANRSIDIDTLEDFVEAERLGRIIFEKNG
jgi:CMP-N-acetylneuraminic acid synthetase